MKMGKKVEEVGLQLPESIIQHIQSFLNGKEAAQTALLSKSWYAAWLTRPDLYFDHKDLATKFDWGRNRLRNYMKKIMERYEKLNLQIHSLWLFSYDSDHSLVKEVIIKALKMGATSLHVDLVRSFPLPYEVFGFENLIKLYVRRCEIGIGPDRKVGCSRLKSLTLEDVSVEADIVGDIIRSCPLIENLSLSNWKGFVFSPFNVGSVVVSSPFGKLKCLLLSTVEVHPLFFNDFSYKFPCLKDLSIDSCCGYKAIQISSPSLEVISFTDSNLLRAEFDVPCICKFTFSGSNPPALTFKTAKRNWKSSINLHHYKHVERPWFLQLNKCLNKLSQSKVSLSLNKVSDERLEYVEDFQGLIKPEVENVTISGPHSVHPAIFCTLFQICRPIYITQYWLSAFGYAKKNHFNFTDFVYKRMVHQVSLDSCIAYQKMSGEFDLEEVTVESYDESISAWCPRSFDILTSPEADHEQRLRLHLRWRH